VKGIADSMKLQRPGFMRALCGALVTTLVAVAAPAHAADPFEIDAVLPLTGSGSFLGREEAQSLRVIEGIVNKTGGIRGRSIAFNVVDDQSNPQIGVQLTNALIAKHVSVVFGSGLTSVCNAMTALAKDGPVEYCFSTGIHPPDGSYVFSAGLSTTDLIAVGVRYIRERGLKRVAVITSTDATGQDADRIIDSVFAAPENAALKIVSREHFGISDVSVAAQMAHARTSGAQILIGWTTGTPLGTLLHGALDAGVDIPIMTGTGNLTYAQMQAYKSFMPRELLFPGIPALVPDELPSGPVKRAVGRFRTVFQTAGIRPDLGHALPWDPAAMVIEAFRKYGTGATPAQIREYLAGVRHWDGVFGQFNFAAVPQRGVGANSVIVERWDPAQDTWVAVSGPGGQPRR